MMKLDLEVSGIFAAAAQGRLQDILRRNARKALRQSFAEWCVAKRLPGLGARFRAESATELGFTPRSLKYRKRQIKKYGAAHPFVSPMLNKTHVRDLINKPDSGFRLKAKNQPGAVVVELTLPGARDFNRHFKGHAAIYRTEFMRLAHPSARRDAAWLIARANELTAAANKEEFAKQERTTLRARSRLNRLLEAG
jgi:hypothetical protein